MKPRAFGGKTLAPFLALLACFGCEQRADPAPAASAPTVRETLEPCRLLSADEASAFLRGSASAAPSEQVAYASSCIWEAQAPRRGLQVMVSSPAQLRADETLRKVDGDTPDKRFAQVVQSQLGRARSASVPNLGDAAFWADEPKQLWILQKNRALVSVSFHGEPNAADLFERSEDVAKKILPRL